MLLENDVLLHNGLESPHNDHIFLGSITAQLPRFQRSYIPKRKIIDTELL